jgi:hypothetical protein
MNKMKMNLPPILDWGVRIIAFFLVLYLSVEADKFAFGMMNAKNTISFGLGVSLFLGINIIAFFTIHKLFKSTINKHFDNVA